MKITINSKIETIATYNSTTYPRIGETVIVERTGMLYYEGVVTKVQTMIVKGIAEVFVEIE